MAKYKRCFTRKDHAFTSDPLYEPEFLFQGNRLDNLKMEMFMIRNPPHHQPHHHHHHHPGSPPSVFEDMSSTRFCLQGVIIFSAFTQLPNSTIKAEATQGHLRLLSHLQLQQNWLDTFFFTSLGKPRLDPIPASSQASLEACFHCLCPLTCSLLSTVT